MEKPIRSTNQRRDWGHTVETVIGSLLLVTLGTLIVFAGRIVIDFTCWAHDPEAPCRIVNPLGATLVGLGVVVMVVGPLLVVRRPR